LPRAVFWRLTLREEHTLRVFVSKVLRRIFGPKREEVTGGWRKLHSEELHNYYLRQALLGYKKKAAIDGKCSTHRGHEKCLQNFRRET
jgi:hypothetical protein